MWHTVTPTHVHICIHTHNRSCAKIYWDGGGHDSLRDAKGSRLAPPLSKLHKQGKALLEAAGWRRTGTNTSLVPAFSWTVRQGGAFGQPGTSASFPPVRQLPQEITDLLDDKRELALTLEAGGVEEVAPETHADVRIALSWPGGAPIAAQDGGEDEQEVWFLKHRRGVKGQAVTPVFSAQVPRALSHVSCCASMMPGRQEGWTRVGTQEYTSMPTHAHLKHQCLLTCGDVCWHA